MLYDLFVASSFFTFLHFPFPTLFLAVDFIRPSGFKILRQELSDTLRFIRRFAPLNHEPCLSQALSYIT